MSINGLILLMAAAVQAAQCYVAPLRHPALLIVVFGLVLWWLGVNLAAWPPAERAAGWAGRSACCGSTNRHARN